MHRALEEALPVKVREGTIGNDAATQVRCDRARDLRSASPPRRFAAGEGKRSVTFAWTTVPDGSGAGDLTTSLPTAEPPLGGRVGGVTSPLLVAGVGDGPHFDPATRSPLAATGTLLSSVTASGRSRARQRARYTPAVAGTPAWTIVQRVRRSCRTGDARRARTARRSWR